MYTSCGRYTGANLLENEFEVGGVAARRARPVVDQQPVGEEAAQRSLELVVMRVDEARHHDAAARVDHRSAIRAQVRPDGDDLLAFDQHVGLRKIADLRVHRHHGAAANEVVADPADRCRQACPRCQPMHHALRTGRRRPRPSRLPSSGNRAARCRGLVDCLHHRVCTFVFLPNGDSTGCSLATHSGANQLDCKCYRQRRWK